MRTLKRFCCAAILVSFGAFGAAQGKAAEFGDYTPYYEDDGWLDITEWFDGNDYNPTDETWWRWDDEVYQASQDTGTDSDSDSWFGYTSRGDNDWYYDYYDPYVYTYYDRDRDDLYEYGSRYYDFDNDGLYDAFASYSDLDGDGLYDDYDFYSFSDNKSGKQQKSQKQVARNSKSQTITGEVQQAKLVKVRGGDQHLVVSIKPQQGQKAVVADLGKVENLKNSKPNIGEKITIKGLNAQVGDHTVILAQSLDGKGQKVQIDRNPRTITARVLDTHKAKIRGQEHLIAMVQPAQKDKNQKMAVDLGRANQLKVNLNKGDTLAFRGFAVKVKDKPLFMAQSVQRGDEFVQINRQSSAVGGSNTAGDSQQGESSQQQGESSQQQQQSSSTNTYRAK